MGKASRKKKERKTQSHNPFSSSSRWKSNPEMTKDAANHFTGTVIYRSFDSEEYADAFVAGDIRLSTLEKCRQYEDPLQGDPEEAVHRYNSGRIVGGSGDAKFVKAAAHSGISIGANCSNVRIINCTNTTIIHDAFVMCTSEVFDPKLSETFGNYWVEISNPAKFFAAIDEVLRSQKQIAYDWGGWGKIIYRERRHEGYEDGPGPIGFVKPKKYQHQKEIRFIWGVKKNVPISPLTLHVPELKNLCRRIA